jgi:hypothetical protein
MGGSIIGFRIKEDLDLHIQSTAPLQTAMQQKTMFCTWDLALATVPLYCMSECPNLLLQYCPSMVKKGMSQPSETGTVPPQ